MLFLCIEDFYQTAKQATPLTREEEKTCAKKMMQGDSEARDRIINAYLPLVASRIRRGLKELQSLNSVYHCLHTLETEVDRFPFLQDHYRFTDYLSSMLRQTLTRCLASK